MIDYNKFNLLMTSQSGKDRKNEITPQYFKRDCVFPCLDTFDTITANINDASRKQFGKKYNFREKNRIGTIRLH